MGWQEEEKGEGGYHHHHGQLFYCIVAEKHLIVVLRFLKNGIVRERVFEMVGRWRDEMRALLDETMKLVHE